jgi:GTPase
MFCDQVVATLKAGKGGDGFVSFRREKWVAHGGPDGGNGGRGGHIVLRVNPNINSLIDLRNSPQIKAEPGVDGHRFDKAGRRGEDLVLDVPPGTLVYDNKRGDLIVDLVEEGDDFILLRGGRGGFGNAHFTSSVRQAPDFAEKGEPGEEVEIRFEMQMVADIGIIGLPSVGKSTLIAHITDAKPKIADYPFTTLIPNMGVVNLNRWGGDKAQTFVVADVPGLIEGAHQGKGLGDEFLRHVSRTAILVHMVDCQAKDMAQDFKVISNELKEYDESLAERPQVVVINKIDTVDEETKEMLMDEFRPCLPVGVPLFAISGVSGAGLRELVLSLWNEVQKLKKTDTVTEKPKAGYRVFRPHLEKGSKEFNVERIESDEGVVFEVQGKRIEQIVVMSPMENRSARMRIYDVLEKMGIMREIRKQEGNAGDIIRIEKRDLEFPG